MYGYGVTKSSYALWGVMTLEPWLPRAPLGCVSLLFTAEPWTKFDKLPTMNLHAVGQPLLQPLLNLGLANPDTKVDLTAPTLRTLAHGFVDHTAVHLVTRFPFPSGANGALSQELATTMSTERTAGVSVSDADSASHLNGAKSGSRRAATLAEDCGNQRSRSPQHCVKPPVVQGKSNP